MPKLPRRAGGMSKVMGIAQKKGVLFIFGTRPEAIKLAPLIRVFQTEPTINVQVCVTAQHRELLDQVLSFFQIKPDADLDLMLPNQSLTGLAARVIAASAEVIESMAPDLVVVQGDTTSAASAAFCASLARVPVAHVEAGLRSHRRNAPFPEEINRALISRLAELHFAHSASAEANLRRENIVEGVHVVGNTGIDALKMALQTIDADEGFHARRFPGVNLARPLVLVTVHRRENIGHPLLGICRGLERLAAEHNVDLYFPVHPNPQIRDTVYKLLSRLENVHLIEPLSYPEFVWMLSQASLIVSDSGGVLEEAETLGVPVLVTREVTERIEALTLHGSELVGADPERLLAAASALLASSERPRSTQSLRTTFGDGRASERILEITRQYLHALSA